MFHRIKWLKCMKCCSFKKCILQSLAICCSIKGINSWAEWIIHFRVCSTSRSRLFSCNNTPLCVPYWVAVLILVSQISHYMCFFFFLNALSKPVLSKLHGHLWYWSHSKRKNIQIPPSLFLCKSADPLWAISNYPEFLLFISVRLDGIIIAEYHTWCTGQPSLSTS